MNSTHRRRRPSARVLAAIAAGLGLLTVAMVALPNHATSTAPRPATTATVQQTETGTPPSALMARRQANDPMAIGRVDAPVVMIAYSEFQCPFCGKFARYTAPTLIRKYVDRGVLRVEWRDFPYLGPESLLAARGGRAAAAQDKFWAFHDALYAHQPAPNSGTITADYLTAKAKSVGLDTTRFCNDLASPEMAGAIQRDFQEGQHIGVTGTPAFIINGQPVIGAQPTAQFEAVIDKALKATQ